MTFKQFLRSMLLLLLVMTLLFLGVLFWLKSYTHHGQKLELPDFVGMDFDKAEEQGDDQTFELVISDSIHIVGRPGGEVVSQNPSAYAKVKENRKVYVTITKYNADVLKTGSLGVMYGQDYESKKNELTHLNIESEIKGYEYDPGEPDHILEVWYEGRPIITGSGRKDEVEIKKGSTLQFVLSKRQGGLVEIPNLQCGTYGAAKFILESSNLKLGEVIDEGPIQDRNSAYVVLQEPAYVPGQMINMGETMVLTIAQAKSENCQ